MARKTPYYVNRFDGGMTHNNRDTSDLSKSSFIAHLDIYRENHRAYVMPGYVSDNGYDGSATGLKVHDVRAFASLGNYMLALGTKSDGTGSKVFQKNIGIDSEWADATTFGFHNEGSDNILVHPFLSTGPSENAVYFPIINGSGADVAEVIAGTYSTHATWLTSAPTSDTGYTYAVRGFDGKVYLVKGGGSSGISELTTSTVTVNAKSTAIIPTAIASGDYSIGIAGNQNSPRNARVLVWDSASLLADQNVRLGSESVRVIGFPNNVFCTVSFPAFNDLESNGLAQMNVRVLTGESAQLIYRITAPTDTNMRQHDMNEYYYNAMLWYARVPTNADGSAFKEGIWAAGAGSATSQFGVSMLLDTTSLGLVERAAQFGFATYFAHNSDGSVSRLDDFETGTYDIPGYIETLFFGADTPGLKQFEGISVVTEDLPSGGSVEVQYRFDENDSWTSLGVSNTTGLEKHSFTKAGGVPIGKFQEIQFKIILNGKITLKSYTVVVVETDDLPYRP